MASRRGRSWHWPVAILVAILTIPSFRTASARDAGANVAPLVAETPGSGFNRLSTTVTVCAPGSARCASIDHVMVDTGSVGLRLQAHAVPRALALPFERDGSGRAVAECLRFVGAAAWGAVHRADVRIAGLVARDIPVQVITQAGGNEIPRAPSCSGTGGHPTANGTLGIGIHPTDCHGACVQNAARPGYLSCSGGGCAAFPGPVPFALQLPNPIRRLPDHADGVVFDVPMPARRGVDHVNGRLILGVGTAANNELGDARPLRLGPTGRICTEYGGIARTDSYLDSGTPFTIVPDDALPRCPGTRLDVCQRPTVRIPATLVGA
ncbi:MAG: DUF3443 family protein, partial [Gluconacetobacter diazotrophicus]|nr:DUF3443 family protein [Gluconacetobacter diazotrophicus]